MKKSKYIRHYFAVSNTDGIFSIMVKDGDLVLGETVLNTGSTMLLILIQTMLLFGLENIKIKKLIRNILMPFSRDTICQ